MSYKISLYLVKKLLIFTWSKIFWGSTKNDQLLFSSLDVLIEKLIILVVVIKFNSLFCTQDV